MDNDSRSTNNVESTVSSKDVDPLYYDWVVLQSCGLRYSTILAYVTNRKFVERQFRFVLYYGAMLWAIFLLSMAI